jgi:hypothetical protein
MHVSVYVYVVYVFLCLTVYCLGYNIVTAQNGNAPMYCNQLSGSPAVPPSQVMSPLHHQLPNQPPPRLMAPYPPGPGQPPAGSPYHHGMVPHLVAPYSVQQPVCYPNAPYQGKVSAGDF